MASLVRPFAKANVNDFLVVMSASLFLALMSQISFYTWFTPVPLSLQTFAVLMIGATLGSKRGALAVLTYLAQGAVGLPVFAGASFGIATLLGPTGGYLLGFVACAFLVGYLVEKNVKTIVALVLGTVAIYAVGVVWLAFFVGVENALAMGAYPFLIGAVAKICAAMALTPVSNKLKSSL